MKKNSIKKISLVVIKLVGIFALTGSTIAICPSSTTVAGTTVTFVGEVTDTGGENTNAWFQYGQTPSYGNATSGQLLSSPGAYCVAVSGLAPCTQYYYQAVARNSAGDSYGANHTFTTACLAPTTDLKINGSDNIVTINYGTSVNISWTSTNSSFCTASGDWTGTKPTSGSTQIQPNSVRTYTYTLTCQSSSGQTVQDSVQVRVNPTLPVVITRPAVVTY